MKHFNDLTAALGAILINRAQRGYGKRPPKTLLSPRWSQASMCPYAEQWTHP
jgi:hypothetical protein